MPPGMMMGPASMSADAMGRSRDLMKAAKEIASRNAAIGKTGQKKPAPETAQITTRNALAMTKVIAWYCTLRLSLRRSIAALRSSSSGNGAPSESGGVHAMIASMESEFRLMGVVNVTPDSFSDGGAFLEADAAIAQGRRLVAEGADLVDVGGESTRPGAAPVSADEEIERVLPVVEAIAGDGKATVSIDTSKLEVAEAALAAGAGYVNDVTAFRAAPELAGLVAQAGVDCCLMHMRGEPRTMQVDPRYDDVVADVAAFLEERLAFAVREGVPEERVHLDPGIGFGKTIDHNLELLRRLDEIAALGRPVVVGTSRKSFLGKITGRDVTERVPATVATSVIAYLNGARIFRVHDVAATRDALLVTAATVSGRWRPTTTASGSSTT